MKRYKAMKNNILLSLDSLFPAVTKIAAQLDGDYGSFELEQIATCTYYHLLQNKLWGDFARKQKEIKGIMIQSYPEFSPTLICYFDDGVKLEKVMGNKYPDYFDFVDAAEDLIMMHEGKEATPETCLKGIFDFDDISQLELAVDCYKEKKGRAYPVTVKHQHEVLMKLYDLIGIDREALGQDKEDETD